MNPLAALLCEAGRYSLILFLVLPFLKLSTVVPLGVIGAGGWIALAAATLALVSGLFGLRYPRARGGHAACRWGIGFSSIVVGFNLFVTTVALGSA